MWKYLALFALTLLVFVEPEVLATVGVTEQAMREMVLALLVALLLQPWFVHHLE